MAFIPKYDKRNRENIGKLADHTKIATLKWYQYCIDNKIDVLIYETIRTLEQQKENVKNGKSQTLKSYHLVGQALDWVLVDNKGNALWNGYNSTNAQKVIKYAKSIGFVSGYDWGWDSPHLQYEYKGYGTDTFNKENTAKIEELHPNANKNTTDKKVNELEFTSSTLKQNLETRLDSKATAQLIDELAQKELGYKSKLKDGKLTDGDLLALSVELAVACAKNHNQ